MEETHRPAAGAAHRPCRPDRHVDRGPGRRRYHDHLQHRPAPVQRPQQVRLGEPRPGVSGRLVHHSAGLLHRPCPGRLQRTGRVLHRARRGREQRGAVPGPRGGFLGQLPLRPEPHHFPRHHQGVRGPDHDLWLAGQRQHRVEQHRPGGRRRHCRLYRHPAAGLGGDRGRAGQPVPPHGCQRRRQGQHHRTDQPDPSPVPGDLPAVRRH